MRRSLLPIACLLAGIVPAAHAGGNVNYLVPAYEPCTPPITTCPAVLESRFTFESVKLKSSKSQYLKDNKTAVSIELKGVRDPSGALVTTDTGNQADDFRLFVPPSQVTVQGVTSAPGLLAPAIVLGIDLKDGRGKASYKTPAGSEDAGVITESTGAPYVIDSDGERFAVTGARSKPAN
jgi:hypothetical protein